MIGKLFCWMGFHDWLCVFRHHWGTDRNDAGSQTTVWTCSRCNKNKTEQWDT